ncbi:S41 family peptidase [Gluconobacter albidus]|uniref:S41 family peptidase n=1 Tax=Gluconobacter albidus TaxID=318683 RepID=UPI0020A13644|nr:S41 family peptidase [Gluconobacter albidus]MCP1274251.1 S41 family peptidase [Gluconobacter albidus]
MRHAARPVTFFMPRSRKAACRVALCLAFCIFVLALHSRRAEAQAPTGAGPDAARPVEATPAPATATAVPPAAPAPPVFSASITRDVLIAALGFLEPRTLEAHSARDFCVWGLDGLTAIDPTLSVTVTQPTTAAPAVVHAPGTATAADKPVGAPLPATLSVLQGQTVLFSRALPAAGSHSAWADLVTAAMQAAWQHSSTLRDAGSDALLQGFFDELFNHLDPYSRYLGPSPATSDRTRRTGSTGTVGLSLGQSGRTIVITAVNANGPAWEAGVDTGEHLVSVNGRSTHGQDAATVQDWLEGDEHSSVTLGIAAKGHRPTAYRLQRVQVPPETVFASTEGPFTVLRVSSFSTQTAEEISQYIDQVVDEPTPDAPPPAPGKGKAAGIILDLRGDRGGVLQQAVTTAALLLDHGVAVTTQGRNPLANHIWAVQGGDMTNGTPVVVLVDGRTASAAEILASALADHRRAVVIGSETLGKGLVQVIGQMPNGGELFVTWSRNQAPLGWPIQGLGVMPQICTSLGAEALQAQLSALKAGNSLQGEAVQMARGARYPVPVAKILEIRKHCPAAIGSDADMDAAKALLSSPAAYKAALESVPDENSAPLH